LISAGQRTGGGADERRKASPRQTPSTFGEQDKALSSRLPGSSDRNDSKRFCVACLMNCPAY
jgi:hypothetical protein